MSRVGAPERTLGSQSGISLRLDAAGDPLVSATFVLRRPPAPDERLGPLIERSVLALDLELRDLGDEAPADPFLVEDVTFELVRSASAGGPGVDRTVTASQHASGPFAHAALEATVEGEAATDLLEALVAGGQRYEVVGRAELPASPGPPTRVRVALGALWQFLDAVADETRCFHLADVANYLPELRNQGIVRVEAGGNRPTSVLSALVRGSRLILEPAGEGPVMSDGIHADLGPAFMLSAFTPGDTEAVSSEQLGAGGGELIERRTGLAALVDPAIGHDRPRFVHLVSMSGGQIDAVLPARQMRATRAAPRTVYVAHNDRLTSVHALLHPRPTGVQLAGAQLPASAALHHVALVEPLELVAFLPERRPGPIVEDIDAPMWRDRWDANRAWYVPEFVLVPPDPSRPVDQRTPFRFDIEPTGGHDLAGNAGITATVTVTLESRRSAATNAAWEAAGQPELQLVALGDLAVRLAIPFRDQDGTTRVEHVPAETVETTGTLGENGGRITARFQLLDNWARLAYGALSPARFQSQDAAVTVSASVEGWRTLRDAPTVVGLDKRWALSAYGPAATRDGGSDGTRNARPNAIAAVPAIHALPIAAASVHPVWQVRPELVAELQRTQYEWSQFAISRSITSFFACATNGPCYRERHNLEWRAIGCRPALQLGQTEYRTYEEIAVTAADGHAKVYRSLRSPGRFLVVPTTHAVGRFEPDQGDRGYRPALLLHSTIDVDNPTNIRCVLAASLQPHLPPFRRQTIVAELRRIAHPDPVLEYLPDCGVAPDISWAVPSHTQVECIPTASGFDVVCSTDPAGFLALRSMLERDGVRGVATVALPGGTRASTALVLGLTTVTGPFAAGPIELSTAHDGKFDLTNRTGQRIAVVALASGGAEVAKVGQLLEPDSTTSVDHPGADPLDVVYEADTGAEVLDEVRAYIEDLELGVVFVATSDPADAGLAGLEITTRLMDQVDDEPLVLTSEHREAERNYLLPLTSFAQDPILEFTVTAVAADATRTSATPVTWPVRSRGALIPVGPPAAPTKAPGTPGDPDHNPRAKDPS